MVKSEVYLNFHLYGEADDEIGMDYFLWVARNPQRTIVVDTGFSASAGRRRGRTAAIAPVAALTGLGLDPAAITRVVVTHGHYDHAGNLRDFADLPQMYRAYDQLRELASQPGTEIIAGHDPAVFTRFPGRGGGSHVVLIGALASHPG